MFSSTNVNTGNPTGGKQEGKNPSNVYMTSSHVDIATISHDYGELESSKAKASPNVPESLHIERPIVEPIPQMLKGSAKHSMISPSARFSQNYSIVEYLAQILYVMSVLEVLQSFPS